MFKQNNLIEKYGVLEFQIGEENDYMCLKLVKRNLYQKVIEFGIKLLLVWILIDVECLIEFVVSLLLFINDCFFVNEIKCVKVNGCFKKLFFKLEDLMNIFESCFYLELYLIIFLGIKDNVYFVV